MIMANILIVDDSASMRQMIKFTLEIDGHKVDAATDGSDGLNMIKKGQFDLVITDVNMPNMNGIEMTAKIRELSNYKSTPHHLTHNRVSHRQKIRRKKSRGNRMVS